MNNKLADVFTSVFKKSRNNPDLTCPICGQQLIWDWDLKDELEPQDKCPDILVYKCRGCGYRKEI